MSMDLLRPPASLSPAEALHRSQHAPTILASQSAWALPWPLSVLTTSDAPEKWTILENLFYSCIRTGDNRSAGLCLDRLKSRFGDINERVMGLVGIYHEAIAPDQQTLEKILKQYDEVIKEKPTNMVIRKRQIALLRTLDRTSEAVSALGDLVEASPTDAEAWSELGEIYFVQKSTAQAIHCFEEALMVTPNAWNMHARLGEVLYVTATASTPVDVGQLTRSMKSFCRSVELCDDYIRGYYGIKFVTNKLQTLLPLGKGSAAANDTEDFAVPSVKTVERLNELATSKLAEIIRKYSTNQQDWTGYNEAEVIAARELLDRDSKQQAPR